MSSLSHDILKILKDEFIEDGRSSDDLRDGYIGLNMNHLQEQILGRGSVSRVDYDLALKELEDGGLVKTGPMTMYDNPPNSHVLVIAMFSKREYIYLTEAGYKVARDMAKNMDRPQSRQNVHISGGHFYQSPIGVGAQVSQQINFDVSSESDSVKYLAELLAQSGKQVDEATKTDLTEMVRAANTGNMTAAKPIFQRIYGMVAEPIKQLAYGVLAAIIAKQMGI
jgi:hypothetical protein